MAAAYKILGQVSPSSTTETVLYTVPGSTAAVASSIIICNRAGTTSTFRVSVSKAGATTSNKDYIYYGLMIGGNDTFIATIGVTLSSSDVVRVYSSTANLSFSLYGSELV